jgi:SOS response associated peptidase (SRAP)
VRDLPTFRDAYRMRRCIVPVDGFFEWNAIKGQGAKQPYAIAMKDGAPFGIAGLWENWKEPASGDSIRTFAVITTDANELVADIHDRMPVILAPGDYARWLSDEPDPRDMMRVFPASLMRMWPISTRVNKPRTTILPSLSRWSWQAMRRSDGEWVRLSCPQALPSGETARLPATRECYHGVRCTSVGPARCAKAGRRPASAMRTTSLLSIPLAPSF